MKKRTALLAGIFAMIAVITSVGITAITFKKSINIAPEGRTEYMMTEEVYEKPEMTKEEIEALEKELEEEEVEEDIFQ